MGRRQITLWLDERWYDALSRHLGEERLEDKLDDYLDAMIDQLPKREYERVSRDIWQEIQRQADEGPRPVSVFRVTQNGQTDHLLTEGDASMDALYTALRLRTYLLRRGNSPERFAETIPAADHIAPEVFREYGDELRQGSRRITASLDIDLDRGEFFVLDAAYGWEVYTIRDVSTAAWHATRKDGLAWEQRQDIFAAELERKLIRCDSPEIAPPSGPTM